MIAVEPTSHHRFARLTKRCRSSGKAAAFGFEPRPYFCTSFASPVAALREVRRFSRGMQAAIQLARESVREDPQIPDSSDLDRAMR